jgi:16S rRNA (guanine966-N2)-methyltransferase
VTRIVAGTLGGRRLATPPGRDTRPTSDRVREALFSTLETLTDLAGSRFADLYAGSGAVGLEAASRGAAAVLLVESEPRAVRVISGNIAALGLDARCRIRTGKVASVIASGAEEPYDVVFADPPYGFDGGEVTAVLAALVEYRWLTDDAVVVVERSTRDPAPDWPPGLVGDRGRRYGESTLWYGRRGWA